MTFERSSLYEIIKGCRELRHPFCSPNHAGTGGAAGEYSNTVVSAPQADRFFSFQPYCSKEPYRATASSTDREPVATP